MILSASNIIMILRSDGTKIPLDVEELEARIIKSCINAGMTDLYIAKEIALAIEYALISTKRSMETFYTRSDIDTIAIKVLQITGFEEVAEAYKRNWMKKNFDIPITKKNIENLISKHLGINAESMEHLVKDIIRACNLLNLSKVSPLLLIELAKHFSTRHASIEETVSIYKQNLSPEPYSSIWEITKEEIISRVDVDGQNYIENKILDVSGISRLFPSIRISVNFSEFVKHMHITPPVTEMTLIPILHFPANAIDKIIEKIYLLDKSREKNSLPIYLESVKTPIFCEQYLKTPWSQGAVICREILNSMAGILKHNIFKIIIH